MLARAAQMIRTHFGRSLGNAVPKPSIPDHVSNLDITLLCRPTFGPRPGSIDLGFCAWFAGVAFREGQATLATPNPTLHNEYRAPLELIRSSSATSQMFFAGGHLVVSGKVRALLSDIGNVEWLPCRLLRYVHFDYSDGCRNKGRWRKEIPEKYFEGLGPRDWMVDLPAVKVNKDDQFYEAIVASNKEASCLLPSKSDRSGIHEFSICGGPSRWGDVEEVSI